MLVTMLDSSVDRQGVISILLTDTELLPAGVDGHGVVPASSLRVEVMSTPCIDGHGVLSGMFLSTVD